MRKFGHYPIVLALFVLSAGNVSATVIDEFLNAPSSSGGLSGKFLITPSEATWAFGVGNESINDTSVSGLSADYINGLEARDHWVSALISKTDWNSGFNFNSIFPIGSVKPSAFEIDTATVSWQWGGAEYVAYYWLSNQVNVSGAVLNAGTQYSAFNFFASAPASPFVTWTQNASGGFDIAASGETTLSGPGAPSTPTPAPEPTTLGLLALALFGTAGARMRRY